MKKFILICATISIISCKDNKTNESSTITETQEMNQAIFNEAEPDPDNTDSSTSTASFSDVVDQYMNAYVVIADTSQNYYKLHQEMFNLSDQLNLEIDTLGKGFDESKNLICLPEDSEDELYAGSYYPRRYPSNTLSLEYLSYYTNGWFPDESRSDNTIALVVSITDKKEEAEKTLSTVKQYMEKAYMLNDSIFMGCMH